MAALGTLQDIVICHPLGVDASPVCPPGTALKIVSAYVLDPAAAAYIDSFATPYDYANGVAFWAWGFTTILILALVSRSAGTIIETLKRIFH